MFQLAPINLSPINKYVDVSGNVVFNWQCIGATPTHATLTFYDVLVPTVPLFTMTKNISIPSKNNYYNFEIYSATLVNGSSYLWDITSYTGASGKTSEKFLIYTHQKPNISFVPAMPAILTDILYEFKTTYTTYDNIILSKYKFELYKIVNTKNILVKTTDWIYDQNVSWYYNGFEDNSNYHIVCTIEDSVYSQGFIEWTFAVNYTEIISSDLIIVPNNEDGYVNITFAGMGVNFGNYYKNNILNATPLFTIGKFGDAIDLEVNSYVIFKEFPVKDYTFNLWFKMDIGFVGDIVKLDDGQTFGFDGIYFYYKTINGYQTITLAVKAPYDNWTFLQMIHGHVFIRNSVQQLIIGGRVWNISYTDPYAYSLAWWSLTTMNGKSFTNSAQAPPTQIGTTVLL